MECFVCFDDSGPLLTDVCACKSAVHAACLERCLAHSALPGGRCAVCLEPYRLQLARRPAPWAWAFVGLLAVGTLVFALGVVGIFRGTPAGAAVYPALASYAVVFVVPSSLLLYRFRNRPFVVPVVLAPPAAIAV